MEPEHATAGAQAPPIAPLPPAVAAVAATGLFSAAELEAFSKAFTGNCSPSGPITRPNVINWKGWSMVWSAYL